jgi:hypothetical protein
MERGTEIRRVEPVQSILTYRRRCDFSIGRFSILSPHPVCGAEGQASLGPGLLEAAA